MKGTSGYLLAILLTGYSLAGLRAQPLTSGELASRMKQYLESNPWEEVFLHVDRDKLIAGEDIWFSIYTMSRETNRLSGRSALAYVELLNPWNTPVMQKRFRLEGGRGEGSLRLPDSLSSGSYTIRAYTRWMSNFLPENCFQQDIDIYNPFKNKDFIKRVKSGIAGRSTFNMEFYPEGGVLLTGGNNRVIIHCFNESGAGIRSSVIIRDSRGDSVTCCTTDLSGYGSFLIDPIPGMSYSVSSPDGLFRLPDATDEGFSVILDNSSSIHVDLLIRASGEEVLKYQGSCFLVIHTGGNIEYSQELKISGTETRLSVPRARLRGGVASAALIREDGKTMFERLFYSDSQHPFTAVLEGDTLYAWRQKVSLSLSSPSELINIKDFSISAVPVETSAISPGINDYMLFGTEYGAVPREILSLRAESNDRDAIDNFLAGSESRWISWTEVLSDSRPQVRNKFEQYGHYLSAEVRYRENRPTSQAQILYMSMRGKIADFRYARRETDGRFHFVLPVDTLLRKLVIQPGFADNNMILGLEPSFPRTYQESFTYRSALPDTLAKLFSRLSFNYQAAKIYETDYRKDLPSGDAGLLKGRRFYGIPEMEVFLADYISLPQMQEVFTELLPGIILRPAGSGYEIKITNPVTGVYYPEPPLVMIDGLIMNDLTVLADLDPELVEKIEVVRTPYLVGDLVLSGIVNVITRSGEFSDVTLPDYVVELPYRVIDRTSRFSAPDYSVEDIMKSRIPDLRNTLYWNPLMKPGTGGGSGIEFWTPDYPGTWVVTINGITQNGNPFAVRRTLRTQ